MTPGTGLEALDGVSGRKGGVPAPESAPFTHVRSTWARVIIGLIRAVGS